MIQFALLALLRPGPDYGYRLRHRFDSEVGSVWCLNVGQVYQALQTLEQKGLVVEVPDPAASRDGGGPGRNRRMFAVTEKGERSLERWLRRVPTRPRPLRDEMLIRLLAAARSGPETARQVLGASERAHRDRLGRAASDLQRAREVGSTLGRLGLDAEIAHLEAHLSWLDRCRRELFGEPAAIASAPEAETFRGEVPARTSTPTVPRPPARANAGRIEPEGRPERRAALVGSRRAPPGERAGVDAVTSVPRAREPRPSR
jgi:DNA-binding PadR family transcriptional regulator